MLAKPPAVQPRRAAGKAGELDQDRFIPRLYWPMTVNCLRSAQHLIKMTPFE